jgi:hypothetical protein
MSSMEVLVKKLRWLGPGLATVGGAIAAVATGAWVVTTYLHNAELDYSKEFNTKQLAALFLTAQTAAGLGDILETSLGRIGCF